MIDKKSFDKIRAEYEELDDKREELIRKSRDIIKLSKNIIYSVHRKEFSQAVQSIEKIKKELKSAEGMAKKHPTIITGLYTAAIQEYVEAVCYYDFVKSGKLTSKESLGVDSEEYLLGCCDLIGELVRNAVNSSIKGDYETAFKIRDFVDEFYSELMKFDFRNSELRRKFDAVKWELKKIDEMVFNLGLNKEKNRNQ